MTKIFNRIDSNKHRCSGFTLVEVMVALLIVAVAISSILTQIMTIVDSTAQLRDKTVANWVALNQLELIYIANENPASRAYNTLLSREISGKEELAGRQWYWKIKPLQGVATGSVPLQVTVLREEGDDSPVVTVFATIDSYHKPR